MTYDLIQKLISETAVKVKERMLKHIKGCLLCISLKGG